MSDDDPEASESRDYQRGHTYLKNATTLLGDHEWWAGDSMTYADVAMFAALHGLDELRPGFLESHGLWTRPVPIGSFVLLLRGMFPLVGRLQHTPRICRQDGGLTSHQGLLGKPTPHPNDSKRRSEGTMV